MQAGHFPSLKEVIKEIWQVTVAVVDQIMENQSPERQVSSSLSAQRLSLGALALRYDQCCHLGHTGVDCDDETFFFRFHYN